MDCKHMIEGSWHLESWAHEPNCWTVPQAQGRFSLRDGMVCFMATRPEAEGRYSRYAYGRYEFGDQTWSYGYDHDTILRESGGSVIVSRDLPWIGLRTFKIEEDGGHVSLQSLQGNYHLLFERDSFRYFENGRLTRAWSRL